MIHNGLPPLGRRKSIRKRTTRPERGPPLLEECAEALSNRFAAVCYWISHHGVTCSPIRCSIRYTADKTLRRTIPRKLKLNIYHTWRTKQFPSQHHFRIPLWEEMAFGKMPRPLVATCDGLRFLIG